MKQRRVRIVSDGTLVGTTITDGNGGQLAVPVAAFRYEMGKGKPGRLWLCVPPGEFEVDLTGDALLCADGDDWEVALYGAEGGSHGP